MARPTKTLPTVSITITVTDIMAGHVDKAVQTGLYGNSRAACCERLVSERLRELLRDKSISITRPVV